MMFQLWDLQPNFIADWVDSRPMAAAPGAGCPARSTQRAGGADRRAAR